MNGVTSNSSDDRNLSLKELGDTVMKLRQQPSVKAIKISRASLLHFPIVPNNQTSLARLYGIPVEIDNSLELFEVKSVE